MAVRAAKGRPIISEPGEISGARQTIVVIGDSGRHIARRLGRYLAGVAARGHHVIALAPAIDATDVGSLIANGIETRVFALKPERRSLWPARAAMKALGGTLSDIGPDAVVIVGDETRAFALGAARSVRKARIVVMIDQVDPRGVDRASVRHLTTVQAIVAPTAATHDAIVKSVPGLNAERVVQIRGAGADLSRFAEMPLPASDGRIVFLCVTDLDRRFGVLDYLEAARILVAEGAAAEFLLAGPSGQGSEAITADMLSRYASAVSYLGDASDVKPLLARAHVFVDPAHASGLSTAGLDALAAGRVIIASDLAGTRDIVDDMINGTLTAPHDVAALADAARRLIRHRTLLATMGRASRAKAERLFDMQSVHARMSAVLGLA